MEYLLIGFFTGLSLILALGAQNVFVIEQGLKRQYTFLVCLICSISDYLLIFLGIILFEFFQSYFNQTIELILNILLLLFLLHFIYSKIKLSVSNVDFSTNKTDETFKSIFLKKDEGQQIDLLNEILKELNEIKFSKRIDELENKLMKDFDEKSYSDLMELKSQRNKE